MPALNQLATFFDIHATCYADFSTLELSQYYRGKAVMQSPTVVDIEGSAYAQALYCRDTYTGKPLNAGILNTSKIISCECTDNSDPSLDNHMRKSLMNNWRAAKQAGLLETTCFFGNKPAVEPEED